MRAKKVKRTQVSPLPDWKAKWPRSGDLRTWMRCMLEKCEAIGDVEEGASKAHLPIDALHELGHTAESIRYVKRFLKRLPKVSNLETVRMHELAAEIQLNEGDLVAVEKHLQTILKLDPSKARKCDRDFPQDSVREFRVHHGLLNPADARDEQQAEKAEFNRAKRLAGELIEQRKPAEARKQIAAMERLAKATEDEFFRSIRYQATLALFARLNDMAAIKRVIRRLGRDQRDEVLGYHALLELGMQREAIQRAERQVIADLEELCEMDNPNIHFPVGSLCRALDFLVEQKETKRARRLMKRVLSECGEWPVYEFGWTTSAVYTMLARTVGLIDGPEAAVQLMESAYEDASTEKRSDWRKGAMRGAIELQADLGYLDEALERARKLRSPRERLFETAKLLARAKRWKELREVCQRAKSPEEAADLCWKIKFELPGGEVR